MTGTQKVDLFQLLAGKPIARVLALSRLNYGANIAMRKIRRDYVPALDGSYLNRSMDTAGKVALPTDIWEQHNGIDFIRPTGSNLISYRLISFKEYQRYIETGLVLTVDPMHPKYYIRNGYVYLLPISGGAIDFYYRKAFTAIAEGTTADADFSDRIQDIIVRLALMGINNDMYESALVDIEDLNNTRVATDSNDILDGAEQFPEENQGHFMFEGLDTFRTVQDVTDDPGDTIQLV